MAVSHKGAISFGLVHIPVGLHKATQDNDIHFNQLCKEDGSRVRYKKVCAGCGKEVTNKDIIKGFEYEEGKYVTLTEDDFEKAKTKQDKTIQILHFSNISSIQPIYFDATYHAIPEKGGDKAFELLRKAMKDTKKVGIAKTVLGTKEKLLCLIPTDRGILVETLFYADEIKEIPKEPAKVKLEKAEVEMAKSLINSMVKDFEPDKYKNEYQQRLWEIINAKIKGKDIITAQDEVQVTVVDLMEALKESLAQAGVKQ